MSSDACLRSDEKKYEILKLKEVYACLGLKASLNSAAVTCIILILSPKHDMIPATMKKINSIPTKTRT